MTKNLPFNLKQTYQTSSIGAYSLLLSRICPKQNILQIVIITIFCKSKNVPNFIILLSLNLLPSHISSQCLLSYFLTMLLIWNVDLFYSMFLYRHKLLQGCFLMLLQILPLFFLLRVINGNQTNLFICTYLSSKLSKIVPL